MTKPVYQHRTTTEHYMEAQAILAKAKALTDPATKALLLQEAQVHATLANAPIRRFRKSRKERIEPGEPEWKKTFVPDWT